MGVLFDLDGTLYEMPRFMKLRVGAKLWTDLRILRHVTGAREWIRQRSFESGEALDRAFFEELGRRASIDASVAARWYAHRFIAAYLSDLERHASPRPGLVSLLADLRDKGVVTAVLSDYERVAERVETLRVPVTLFDVLMSAGESGALKPSAASFLMAATRMGLAPDEVLVVGDRDDMDGAGARAAGMPFLGVAGVATTNAPAGYLPWPRVLEKLSRLGSG